MSIRAWVVRAAITASRRAQIWHSADAFHAAVADRKAWPAPPPRRIRGAAIFTSEFGGWPLVTLAPTDRTPTGTFVYLPGGGYAFDMVREHWSFLGDLVRRTGRRVVVMRYPLAPVGQADTVVECVADFVASLHFDGPLSLGGDSAGGGMALAAAEVLRDRGQGGIDLMLLSPWVDVTMTDPAVPAAAARDPWLAPPGLRAAGDLYRGALTTDDPRVSPIHGDLTGLGRVIIATGTDDVLNPDARKLAELLEKSSVSVRLLEAQGLLHNFPLMPIPEATAARRILFGHVIAADR